MKITIVYQYYQTHAEPGHSLIYELAHYLADSGHSVTVVAGEFGYMKRQSASKLPWYRRLLYREQDGNVRVVRAYAYPEIHRGYLWRLLSFLSFSITCPLGMLLAGKADVVLASSPPIFPMVPAWFMSWIRSTPFVLEVRDIWPAAAVQMGILHNRTLIAIMRWIERLLYNRATKIVTLTEGLREDIVSRGWPKKKIAVVTCGVDARFLYPDAEAGRRARERHNWEDKKIVLYFGALGEANNIPVILRAAGRLKGRKDILFVLIGDGMLRPLFEQEKIQNNLDNVLILPPVPKSEARFYINAADLCLVTLRDVPLFGMSAIPTKLVDYMACGRPLLYGARGETQQMIADLGCGCVFEPNDDRQLSEQILDLTANAEAAAKMGACGALYVAQHFALTVTQLQMKAILEDAAANDGKAPSSCFTA